MAQLIQLPYPHNRENKTIQDNVYLDSVERALRTISTYPIPGPYASDAAAKAAGIQIGCAYHLASGAIVVRLV